MRKLLSLLTALLFVGSMWGTNATLTFNNIGANLATTADAENVQTATITATEGGSYTINYLNCKKYSSAIMLTKGSNGGNAFFSNKTPIPGNIVSITVYTNEGSAADASYHCAFNTTECTSRYTTGSTASKIGAGSNHTYNCSVSNAKYFCVAINNNNNGQVIKIEVVYEAVPSITFSPKTIDFGTVVQGSSVSAETFTISAVHLTEDGILIDAGGTHFSVSEELLEADNNGAIAETAITVTPSTENAGTFNEQIKLGGTSDFSTDSVVNVKMTVLAKSAVTITNPDHGTMTIKDAEEDELESGDIIIEGQVLSVSVSGSGYSFTPKAYKTGDVEAVVTITDGKLTMPAYAITITADEEKLSCSQLAAPTLNGSVVLTYYSAILSWNQVANAEGYVLSVINHETDEVVIDNESMAGLTNTTKNIANLAANTRYDYTVMAVGDGETYCDANNLLLEGYFYTEDYPAATLTLSENGDEHDLSGDFKMKDIVTLPSTVNKGIDDKVFVGWDANANCSSDPTYAPGAEYTLESVSQKLYAVYATKNEGATSSWVLTYSDISKTGTGSGYAAYDGAHTKAGINFTTSNVMVGTGDNANKIQFKSSSGKLYNTDEFATDIKSITIAGADMNVFADDEEISSTPASGAITKVDGAYPVAAGNRFFHLKMGSSTGYVSSITVTLSGEINYSDYATTGSYTPTAIDMAETSEKAVKVLKNGILMIEKNGKTYNAQGQLVK